jgi:hypothetical protein
MWICVYLSAGFGYPFGFQVSAGLVLVMDFHPNRFSVRVRVLISGFDFGCTETPPDPNPTRCHPQAHKLELRRAIGSRGESFKTWHIHNTYHYVLTCKKLGCKSYFDKFIQKRQFSDVCALQDEISRISSSSAYAPQIFYFYIFLVWICIQLLVYIYMCYRYAKFFKEKSELKNIFNWFLYFHLICSLHYIFCHDRMYMSARGVLEIFSSSFLSSTKPLTHVDFFSFSFLI